MAVDVSVAIHGIRWDSRGSVRGAPRPRTCPRLSAKKKKSNNVQPCGKLAHSVMFLRLMVCAIPAANSPQVREKQLYRPNDLQGLNWTHPSSFAEWYAGTATKFLGHRYAALVVVPVVSNFKPNVFFYLFPGIPLPYVHVYISILPTRAQENIYPLNCWLVSALQWLPRQSYTMTTHSPEWFPPTRHVRQISSGGVLEVIYPTGNKLDIHRVSSRQAHTSWITGLFRLHCDFHYGCGLCRHASAIYVCPSEACEANA